VDDLEQRAIIHILAKQAKNQYRELLAHRMLAQYLKDHGYKDQDQRDVDEILESARQSPELQAASAKYEQAVDSKIPPFDEVSLEKVLQKWLEALPPTGLPN